MDYTLIYAGLAVVGCIVFVVGFIYLKNKKVITSDDLSTISLGLGIASEVLTTLGVKATAKNKQMLSIISTAMSEAADLLKGVKDDNLDTIKTEVYDSSLKACEEAKLTLSDKEKSLLKSMSDAAVELSYKALKEAK